MVFDVVPLHSMKLYFLFLIVLTLLTIPLYMLFDAFLLHSTKLYFLFVIVLTFFSADVPVMTKDCVTNRWEENIVRSCEDKRLYRYLTLKNSMKVLLISDQTTDKSAASLDVHIGQLQLDVKCLG